MPLKPLRYGGKDYIMDFEIQSQYISDEQQDKQNEMVKKAIESDKKVVINSAPTGFGKTHIQLALGKNNPSFLFTPTTKVTFEFLKAHQLQQEENHSALDIGFIIGKGQRDPVMCPLLELDKNRNEKKQETLKDRETNEKKLDDVSIYDYCKNSVAAKECEFYKETYSAPGELRTQAIGMIRDILEMYNEQQYSFYDIVKKISHEKFCPFCILKETATAASTKVCDFNYFINKEFTKMITDDTSEYYAIIDECDAFLERLDNIYNTSISFKNLEYAIKTINNYLEAYEGVSAIERAPIRAGDKIEEEKREFLNHSKQFVQLFQSWLHDKEKYASDITSISFNDELEKNETLIDCHALYNFLKNRYSKIIVKYNEGHHDGLVKLFKFFSSLGNISDYDVVYYLENNQGEIKFERKSICYRHFFKYKMASYNKILLFSATPPPNEILQMNFNNDYEICDVNWPYKNRSGVIYIDDAFNLSGKCQADWYKNWDKKVDQLVRVLKESPVSENVVFVKANKYVTDEPGMIVKNRCRQAGITPFFCSDVKSEDEELVWSKYQNSAKRGNKSVIFATAHGRWARGVNKLKGNGCRFLIIWGIPIKRLPNHVVQAGFNREFRRQSSPLNFMTYWCRVLPKSTYLQSIGRLVRGEDDYGFFTILTHKNISNILNQEHQRHLGIECTTKNFQDLSHEMKMFFDGVDSKR